MSTRVTTLGLTAVYAVIVAIGVVEPWREGAATALGWEEMTPALIAALALWALCILRPYAASQAHAGINGPLHRVAQTIAIVLLAIMVSVILVQIVSRYVFNNPLNWTEEAARFGMLWMTGLMAPIAYRAGGFVAIDMLERALPTLLQRLLVLALLLMSLMVLVVGWDKGFNNHVDTITGRGCSATLRWPLDIEIGKCRNKFSNYYQYLSLWIGVGLLILVNIELVLRQVVKLTGGQAKLIPLHDDDMLRAD